MPQELPRYPGWAPIRRGCVATTTALPAVARLRDGRIYHVSCQGFPQDGLYEIERVLWSYDATEVFRAFAREVALDVVHLWDAPPEALRFLEATEEDRYAARRAAQDVLAFPTTDDPRKREAWGAARAAAREATADVPWVAASATAAHAAVAWAWIEGGSGAEAWDAARRAATERYERQLVDLVDAGHAAHRRHLLWRPQCRYM